MVGIIEGTPSIIKKQNTLTAKYLNNKKRVHAPKYRRKGNGKSLILKDIGNNLKDIDINTLGIMVGITGVS